MSTNNITGDNLISKANTKAFADNYDRIFKKVDELDRASDYEQLARSAAIATACILASEPLPTAKKCLNCGDKTKGGNRWCSAACRDDFCEREK